MINVFHSGEKDISLQKIDQETIGLMKNLNNIHIKQCIYVRFHYNHHLYCSQN